MKKGLLKLVTLSILVVTLASCAKVHRAAFKAPTLLTKLPKLEVPIGKFPDQSTLPAVE